MLWELIIDTIETRCLIGIDASEIGVPQRLHVSARLWADYASQPRDISACADYSLLHDVVVTQWPKRPQTDLLETLVIELFTHIFSTAPLVQKAEISITKPDIFTEARTVGLCATLTRQEYEAL